MTCNYNGSRVCKRGMDIGRRLCGWIVWFNQRQDSFRITETNVVLCKQGGVGGTKKTKRVEETINKIIRRGGS
jgi:hypothetical protein